MIARAIANDLCYELEIYQYEFDGLIMALNNGAIDLIIAGMSPTEERKQSINFSDAYYRSEHVILVKKTSKYIDAKTFADLTGAKVIGQKGTIYDTLAKQLSQKNSSVKYLSPLDTVNDILVPLRADAIDLTILEEPVAKLIASGGI
jgi:ABC-type amino acid transport substrate-binding protein